MFNIMICNITKIRIRLSICTSSDVVLSSICSFNKKRNRLEIDNNDFLSEMYIHWAVEGLLTLILLVLAICLAVKMCNSKTYVSRH